MQLKLPEIAQASDQCLLCGEHMDTEKGTSYGEIELSARNFLAEMSESVGDGKLFRPGTG